MGYSKIMINNLTKNCNFIACAPGVKRGRVLGGREKERGIGQRG